MLSYRHSFHAGNHADLLKHSVLCLILEALKEKDKAICYLDSHAGAGKYALSSAQAGRTGEYLAGVARLWRQPDAPPALSPLLSVLHSCNPDGVLRYYPGSPLIASQLLRPQDSLHLSELHPADHTALRGLLHKDKRAHIVRANGFQQIKAKLPPPSRRGLVLIDPAYELKEDYMAVVQALNDGYKRFATGVYALWYPVVLRQPIKRLCKTLRESGMRRVLQIELAVRPDSTQRGMTASGMIVINPPWRLAQQMSQLLPWLHHKLVPTGHGHTLVHWLVDE